MPTGALRRVMLLVLLAAAGGALLAWFRQRSPVGEPMPQWPPMQPLGGADDGPVLRAVESSPTPGWRRPDDDGNPPEGFPVKVKESSGIFHVPGGRSYDRTRPDRCYPTPSAAEADGYRRSKS